LHKCSSPAVIDLASVGLVLSIIYFFFQWIVLVYIYIPVCFLFTANFGLFYIGDEAVGDFTNEFFEFMVTAQVKTASHVRCRVSTTAVQMNHEILELSGTHTEIFLKS
jgi:hypothetical protein